MTTIRLYLGAHKTATTHVQGILAANRSALLASGVTLSSPQDLRTTWLPRFFEAQVALSQTGRIPEDLARALRALCPDRGDWILTEENIIGIPIELTRTRGIYPMGGRRLETLRALFPEARIEFHFSLRSYDSFYRSMYSEVIRNRGFMPFADFFAIRRGLCDSWQTLIGQVAHSIAPKAITLWRFEDFRAVQDDVLRGLTGIDDVAPLIARYAPETTRPSLSQKTVDLLSDLAPAIGANEAMRLTERINRHYAVGAGHAPLEVFDEETARLFRDQYAQDIAAIVRAFPGLTFLAPGQNASRPSA